MSVSIESLQGLARRVVINVPAAEVEKAYQSRLKEVSAQAKISGFRPGKVPPKILETRMGKGILEEVAGELMQNNFYQLLETNHVHVAGAPQIQINKPLKKGEPIDFTVNFEVYPEVKLNSLQGEVVTRHQVELTEADIDQMVENLRKQYTEWNSVDRAAKIGDRAVIDFDGTIEGKAFERGKANDFTVELGANRMITGFEEGIVGAKPNEVREIKVTFPQDYPSPEVAGQEALFKITIHKINEPILPIVNDEFAKKLGIQEGTVEGLRAEIRKSVEAECQKTLHQQLKMAVLDKLIAKNPIEIPDALVDAEINHLQQTTRQRIAAQTKDEEGAKKMELPREPFTKQAKKRVILGLLLSEYIKQHHIKADAHLVRSRIEEIAVTYPKPEEVISWYYGNKKRLAEIEAVVMEDQAVDQLLSEMTLEEKPLSYEAVMKQQHESES